MPVTLPLEVYEALERGLGKEDARIVVKSLEAVIGDEVVNKWHQTKEELKTELLKEVATKAELENVRHELLGKIEALYEKTEKDKAELLGIIKQNKVELEGKIEKLNQKFNFMIILMIIALTLMNPVVAEIIKRLIRL